MSSMSIRLEPVSGSANLVVFTCDRCGMIDELDGDAPMAGQVGAFMAGHAWCAPRRRVTDVPRQAVRE